MREAGNILLVVGLSLIGLAIVVGIKTGGLTGPRRISWWIGGAGVLAVVASQFLYHRTGARD